MIGVDKEQHPSCFFWGVGLGWDIFSITVKLRVPFTLHFRSVFIADLMNGKLESRQTLTVRFSEFEASVEGILSKVHDALREEDTFILTDGQGNRIIDSEGTRGTVEYLVLNINFAFNDVFHILKKPSYFTHIKGAL